MGNPHLPRATFVHCETVSFQGSHDAMAAMAAIAAISQLASRMSGRKMRRSSTAVWVAWTGSAATKCCACGSTASPELDKPFVGRSTGRVSGTACRGWGCDKTGQGAPLARFARSPHDARPAALPTIGVLHHRSAPSVAHRDRGVVVVVVVVLSKGSAAKAQGWARDASTCRRERVPGRAAARCTSARGDCV